VASERAPAATSVERFFQFSLLGLIASGCAALAATGLPDRATLTLTFAGLMVRAAMVMGLVRIEIPVNVVSLTALAYAAFFPLDFYFISHDFLTTTVRGVCFLATLKILTAKSNRDYVYTGAISFVELIAAAMLSAESGFFGWLALYVVFAIAAFTSAEIRRSLRRNNQSTAAPRASMNGPLAALAVVSLGTILILTAGLFLLLPRTARMAAMLFPNSPRLTGFSNVVDLGGFGRISRDDRAVMHILPYTRALPADLKWRGAALSHFDGRQWTEPRGAGRMIPVAHGYAEVANESQRSRRDGRRLVYRVDLQNSGTGALFVAGIPEFINIDARALTATADDALRVPGLINETLRYEVSAHSGPPLAAPLAPSERGRYLELPPVDTRIYDLARSWSGQGSPWERANRIQTHLQRDFKYKLESAQLPVGDPLADFLFVRKEGYCEYFASAMAVMLRSEGIPARVATGFQSGYFNFVSGLYVVRASDAHAWVEAWIDGRGWTTFDPTPYAPGVKTSSLVTTVSMYLDAADHAWHEWVISYDLGHQVAIAARFEAALRGWNRRGSSGLPGSAWLAGLRSWGVWIAAVLLAAFASPGLFAGWRKKARLRKIARSGGSASDASVLYERMLELLARRGFEKPRSATPAEFARILTGEESRAVKEFTAVYNSVRFGGELSGTARLAAMLQGFEK
jgi:protein-glutamine gamma-glutamyltransferase